jgi:hypothetical protein
METSRIWAEIAKNIDDIWTSTSPIAEKIDLKTVLSIKLIVSA